MLCSYMVVRDYISRYNTISGDHKILKKGKLYLLLFA